MPLAFRHAIREDVKLMIGLGGPSGGGKTFSALRLAIGLAGGRPIFAIDTEARRMLHYADQFKFQHAELKAPFSPTAYESAVTGAVDAGAAVVIVDSMSHEHEGQGGILEMHAAELQRMAGDDWAKRERSKFAAWIKPKAEHNRLVNTLLQLPVHFIFCFRAKDKLALVKNAQGKQEPVSIGWQPICSDRFEFEMTMMLVLPPGAGGVPDLEAQATKLQEQHRSVIKPGQKLTEDTGRRLAEWAKGASTVTPSTEHTANVQQNGAQTPNSLEQSANVDNIDSSMIKLGGELVVRVHSADDVETVDRILSKNARGLEKYRAWNEDKYNELLALAAQRKVDILNER